MLGLAVKLALRCIGLRVRTVGYVEREAYAAADLMARMEDETLDNAPIWDELATFDARAWRGRVDIVTAGYPCQPFSAAGRRGGVGDARHLWPHVRRVLEETQPGIVFLENVPGHVRLGYREVRGDLEAAGFCVTEGLFSAEEVGASHLRIRLFILAIAERNATGRRFGGKPERERSGRAELAGEGQEVADASGRERGPGGSSTAEGSQRKGVPNPDGAGPELADAEGERREGKRIPGRSREAWLGTANAERNGKALAESATVFVPPPDDREGWAGLLRGRPDLEPALRLHADGAAGDLDGLRIPYRVDQLRLVGNSVCPQAAAAAFLQLFCCLMEE